jgi:hypothetical protein
MKRKFLVRGSVALVIFLALTLGVNIGKTYAATGCFTDTNGNWAETFICWLKDNGISNGYGDGTYGPNNNVTRAEMAVFLSRVAEIPPSTGEIYINAGLDDWVKAGSAGNYVNYFSNLTRLRAPGTGSYYFQVTPDLPASFYGRILYTHSVKLCYDATSGASITSVAFRHYLLDATGPVIYREVVDNTSRSDATCRIYTFPSDGFLYGSDHVVLYILGEFPGAGDAIDIWATTFTLVPSIYPGVLSQEDAIEIRTGMQSIEPASGESETSP